MNRRKPRPSSAPAPSADPRTSVLLAVTGESPAVLTETVWALANAAPPTLPSRVIVVTTSVGAARLKSELLSPSPAFANRSPWQALRDELLAGRPDASQLLKLEEPRIITGAADPDGRARQLDDLRSRADNEAAADFILEQVRAITANSDVRLIASIAGGRKSMGALLYAALTLVGRESDRLTHVLVNAPFDQRLDPPFFFPSRKATRHLLCTRDGQTTPYSSSSARIELASVPFVPLRNAFEDLHSAVGGFAGLVARYSSELVRRADHIPVLSLEEEKPAVVIDGKRLPLSSKEAPPRMQIAILATVLAVQPHLPPDGRLDPESFSQIVRAHHGHPWKLDGHDQRTARAIAEKVDHKAPPERIVDFLDRLDGIKVTRTLSQFRLQIREKLGLNWLAKRGSLRLPPFLPAPPG